MSAPPPARADDGRPRRRTLARVAQAIGFVLGLLLIAWCVRKAFAGDGAAETWRLIRAAPTWMLVGLVATTLASLVANGLMFWTAIRPVRRMSILELQSVNALASLLNYAPLPLRLGLVARVAYHWRVDRMPPGLIGAWLLAVLLAALVAVGACAVALLAAPRFGAAGFLPLALAVAAIGVLVVRAAACWRPIASRSRGAERMFGDTRAFGGAVLLRGVDIAAWSARMVLAAAILEAPLAVGEAAFLGIAAIVASLNPLGRFGFREAAVAWLAATLFAGRLDGPELEGLFARLALVESAAEGLVVIPIGAAAALACWRRVRRAV